MHILTVPITMLIAVCVFPGCQCQNNAETPTPAGSISGVAVPEGEVIVAVGDAWEDAVGKLNKFGTKPKGIIDSWAFTPEEVQDMHLDLPKLPKTRRVWFLPNGDAVKLWGDDRVGASPPRSVSRIDQAITIEKDGIVSIFGQAHKVKRVRIDLPPNVRYTIDDFRPYLTEKYNINDIGQEFPFVNCFNAGGMFVWSTYRFADGSSLVVGEHGKGSARWYDKSWNLIEAFPFGTVMGTKRVP